MISSNKIFCIAVILLSFVYKSASIHCFYCNSANNSACTNINELDEEYRSRLIPIVHCEASIIPPNPTMQFFCRKIVQTIYQVHGYEERVTRGCGWMRTHQQCYHTHSNDHKETACQCFSDYCNSGEMDPASATALFLSLSAVLFFYR